MKEREPEEAEETQGNTSEIRMQEEEQVGRNDGESCLLVACLGTKL